jgi:spermidine synthase
MANCKIKGGIIFRCSDAYGEIFVADDCGMRSLCFGPGTVQSSISLERPDMLIEDHCQAIISSLIFKQDPCSILMIGLGGCSLVNFLLSAFPGCRLDIVEIRQKVIDLAHEFFLSPDRRGNLNIFHAPGEDFIRRDEKTCYDLIIVDAFDEGGPAAPLGEKAFLDACLTRLNKDGIFSMNLWNRPKDDFPSRYALVREVFGGATLKLLLPGIHQNVIVFGSPDSSRFLGLPAYRRLAREMQLKYGVNFPKYLAYLCWHNFG